MDDIDELFDREPWPHQRYGVSQVIDSIRSNNEPVCLTSPTGGGKTQIMIALLRWARDHGMRACLYTNRNLLLEQTGRVLDAHDINYGVRAAAFPKQFATMRDVQLCSIQTEISQVINKGSRNLHDAQVVLIDEAHLMKTGGSEQIINRHVFGSGKVIGVTATPMGISHIYPNLIVAGRNSELRKCGSLVPARVFAPDEFDTSKVKRTLTGEFNLNDIRKKVWTPAIIGRVFDKWKEYNPDAKPSIGFAPGVQESVWFAEQFTARGVRSAHIDGNDVWIDGEFYASDPEARRQIFDEWRNGLILGPVWNRFVLREGIDAPFLHHLILATPIGSLLSYVQIVGRVLRKSEETPDYVVITDHGGSWWRHGSPNEDWPWEEFYNLSVYNVSSMRENRLREEKATNPEPITCPNCGLVRRSGPSCPPEPIGCGFTHHRKSRMVLQHNGELKEVTGEIFRPRRRRQTPEAQRIWDDMYFPSSRSKSNRAMTFLQIEANFFRETGYYPPRDLKNMPLQEIDWIRKARDVPYHRLRREMETA